MYMIHIILGRVITHIFPYILIELMTIIRHIHKMCGTLSHPLNASILWLAYETHSEK